jgi:tetratricopeptide (TPR) repeat protein
MIRDARHDCRGVVALPMLLCLCMAAACSSPEQRREQALREAEQAVAIGELGQAETGLREHLRYAPGDITVRTRLAQLLEQQGRSCEALPLLGSLPAGVEPDLPARQALGQLLLSCRRFTRCAPVLVALEAEGALQPGRKEELLRAVARDRSAPEVARLVPASWSHELVLLCLQAGKLEEAIGCIEQLPIDDPERIGLTDQVLRHAVQNNQLKPLEHSPELYQQGATPWQLLAHHRVLLKRDQWTSAIAIEQAFVERYPEHPQRYEILLAMARRAVATGHYLIGLERADEAIQLDPGRCAALVVKGRALQGIGRDQEARQVFELVLDLQSDHPVAQRMLEEKTDGSTIDLHLTATRAATSGGR